jgi:bifunctional UDP-N-acetylglucosamine pyrophosphorylase/glucosamine-1-phosphate N-acetyltransferase
MPGKSPAALAPLSVVILAAGQGKRMHSSVPKVLQPLAGAPLLAHVLELAAGLGPASIHIVHGHGGDQVRRQFVDPRLHWWHQAEQLGTAHALAQALPGIENGQRVLVLYGDVPLLRAATLQELLARAPADGIGLLSAQLPEPTGYGRIVRDARGAVRRIVEEREASARERRLREINTGVLVAPARRLKQWLPLVKLRATQAEHYLTDIIEIASRARRPIVAIGASDAREVLGINDRQQLAAAEGVYRQRRAAELLAQGVTLVDPARIDLRGVLTMGRDVVLDVNVVLEGPVHLGDGVRIGANCVISNATLGERTRLHPNCVVQDAVIGSDCQIGPFTRVRPESHIEDHVHLGNFVEVKKSRIGSGSKANHLSYIGDAEIGREVNVGAGTITCNYDGANKWPTRIGDRAFIGSGSMLVAPVTVGAGATIGAGSTITADAPAGKLTLARTRQLTIEQWQRPRRTRSKS